MSSAFKLQPSLDFEWTTCCVCGAVVVLTAIQMKELRRNGREFYCPSGHSLHFDPNESKEKRLQRELDAAQMKINTLKKENEYQENLKQKFEKKLRRLTKNGVCPCCHRSFINVKRHMETKHPGFLEKK